MQTVKTNNHCHRRNYVCLSVWANSKHLFQLCLKQTLHKTKVGIGFCDEPKHYSSFDGASRIFAFKEAHYFRALNFATKPNSLTACSIFFLCGGLTDIAKVVFKGRSITYAVFMLCSLIEYGQFHQMEKFYTQYTLRP